MWVNEMIDFSNVRMMEYLVVDLIVLFLVILVFINSYVSEMQKREWCYAYIRYDYCFCQNDPDFLINRSVTINPFEPRSVIPEEDMNKSIFKNILRVNEENKKLGIK